MCLLSVGHEGPSRPYCVIRGNCLVSRGRVARLSDSVTNIAILYYRQEKISGWNYLH
jgi:hypothetical protein